MHHQQSGYALGCHHDHTRCAHADHSHPKHVHTGHAHGDHSDHDHGVKPEDQVALADVELGHGVRKAGAALAEPLLADWHKAQLSWMHCLALVVGLATKASPLPRWGSALIQVGSTVYGAVSSVANVRSCKDAILKGEQQRLQMH